jgi:serine/threonine-protein kinase
MLTGKLPFQSDSQYSLMTAHLNQIPAAPITLRSDLPAALNEIIMMAMAKDPANRFQSADALRAALRTVPVGDFARAATTVTPTGKSAGATTLMDTLLPPDKRTPAPAGNPGPRPAVTPALQTMPMPPAPAPVGPSSQAARPGGSRGLWLALGALLGVGLLIAAGWYVPRRFGTHADPSQATFPSQPGTDHSAAAQADRSTKPENSSAPVVSLEGPTGSVKVDANGNVSLAGPSGGVRVDGTTGSVTLSGKGGTVAVKPNGQDRSSGNPTPARVGTAKNVGQQESAAPAVPPGPAPEEVEKAEDEADQLNVRAAAASRSVDTLRQQQTAAGYSLRGDIQSSEERMQLYLAKGNAALKAQDLKNAQKYFDLAESELTKLEKFLGH